MNLQNFQDHFCHHCPTLMDATGFFAVLVPLVETGEGLSLLFEVRAGGLHHHASEVCFPGGRMENGETPEACALRETREELGIPADAIDVLGALDFLHLRSEGLLFPVLARMDSSALSALRLNAEEVADTFLVPVSFFEKNPPHLYRYDLLPAVDDGFPYREVGTPPGYSWTPGRMEVPVYSGLAYPLWGMTARITDWLFRQMRP